MGSPGIRSITRTQPFLIAGLLIALAWSQAATGELRPLFTELKPFHAEYVAEFRGLPVKARGIRRLEKIDDNRYRLSSSADSLMVDVREVSEFELADGRLVPLRYQYERKGIGKNKLETSQFDWANGLVRHDEGETPLQDFTLDKLSYQYQLRLDVAAAVAGGETDRALTYLISDEEKRKQYTFRIAGEESLATPVGDLNTVRVERIHDPDDEEPRRTAMWLWTDNDYVLVRLRIEDGKRGFELNLDAFEDLGLPTAAE